MSADRDRRLARPASAGSPARRIRSTRGVIEIATRYIDACGMVIVRVTDVCAAVGCSERALRYAFHKFYGVGPHRYLHIRRLHAIRANLVVADPEHDTVGGVMRRLGVTDAGRIAGEY